MDEAYLKNRCLYRDHVLNFTPVRLATGRYRAHVSIVALRGDQTRRQHFLDLAEHDTEAQAAAEGEHAGKRWVEETLAVPTTFY